VHRWHGSLPERAFCQPDAIGAQSNEVKYLLADVDTDYASDAVVVSVFDFIAASPVHRR